MSHRRSCALQTSQKLIGKSLLEMRLFGRVLREMAVVDFQWAAVCFVKRRLRGPGFRHAKTFYKYRSQFLVGDLLNISWALPYTSMNTGGVNQPSIVSFRRISRNRIAGFRERLKSIAMLKSDKEPLIQLADSSHCGCHQERGEGLFDLLHLIDEKMIGLTIWPPASS